jgi:glycosyl transferase family 25
MLVFVINLDRDKDRMLRMVAEAGRVGISFERFVAVDGHRLEPELRSFFFAGDVAHEEAMSPGEVGCYASHLRIHQILASETENQCALVLEDDIALADDLPRVIAAVLSLKIDWDIIRLSNAPKWVVLPKASLGDGRELVRYWTVPNGTGAYLISRTGAIKFCEAFDKRTLPVDEDLRRPWRTGMDVYGVVPPPVEPDVCGASSIRAMGRVRGRPARARFRGAKPYLDILGAARYRLETFGPLGFCRGLFRMWICSLVEVIRGRAAARKLYRLRPSPDFE